MSYTASGPNEIVKVNYDATTDPTTGNDETEGYSIGSRWVNTTTDKEYVAVSVATGSASWEPTTLSDGTTAQDAALFAERADHVNTPAAGLAEIWVENAAQQEVVFTDDLDVDYHLLRVNQVDETLYRICVMGTTGTGLVNNYATLNTNAGLDLVLGSAGAGVIVTEHTTTNGPPVTAGQGAFWTKTGTPNVPMFTNDAGTELNLNPSQYMRFSGAPNPETDLWRTWELNGGWGNDVVWGQAAGSSGTGSVTIDPSTTMRAGNLITFPDACVLEEVTLWVNPGSAHAAFDIYFDLWKMAMADGDTADGTKTRMFRITWNMDGTTNKLYLKTPTLDTGVINANDGLQLFFTTPDAAGSAETMRFNITLKYRLA